MKRRKEEAEQTREALLTAALMVFSAKGYSASTLEDIAATAKVTRGALYHHFAGKAAMFDALLAQNLSRTNQIVKETLNQGGSFLQVMQQVFVQQIILVKTDAVYRATIELLMFKLEANPELESVKQQLNAGRQASLELLARSFTTGQQLGLVRANLQPLELARMFLSLQTGLFHLWTSNPDGFDLELSANALAEVMLAGMKA